jgi:hypothetical protein
MRRTGRIVNKLRQLFDLLKPQPKPKRLCVCFISYQTADALLRLKKGWRIAKEEDNNKVVGKVWLEKTDK